MVAGVATPAQKEARQQIKPDHHYDDRAFDGISINSTGRRIRSFLCDDFGCSLQRLILNLSNCVLIH